MLQWDKVWTYLMFLRPMVSILQIQGIIKSSLKSKQRRLSISLNFYTINPSRQMSLSFPNQTAVSPVYQLESKRFKETALYSTYLTKKRQINLNMVLMLSMVMKIIRSQSLKTQRIQQINLWKSTMEMRYLLNATRILKYSKQQRQQNKRS